MSTVRALHEHCMSAEISELNVSVDKNIGERKLELKKSIDEAHCQTT